MDSALWIPLEALFGSALIDARVRGNSERPICNNIPRKCVSFPRCRSFRANGLETMRMIRLILCIAVYLGTVNHSFGVEVQSRMVLLNGRDLGSFYTWLVDEKYEDPRSVF